LAMRSVGGRHAHDQARGGDDAVIRAEHGGAQPCGVAAAMPFRGMVAAAHQRNGAPPPIIPCMPRIRPFMPPRPIFDIIFSICWYCFISLLTSAGVRPEPAAMRLRREPFSKAGLRRSFFVIEL